jgi:hypothetical protein
MHQTTPAKPAPGYPFNWPAGKPSRESRRPKRKWRRKTGGLTPAGACRSLHVPTPHAAAGIGVPNTKAHSATLPMQALFLCPHPPLWRAVRCSRKTGRPLSPVRQRRTVRLHPDWRQGRRLQPSTKESVIMPRKTTRAQATPEKSITGQVQHGCLLAGIDFKDGINFIFDLGEIEPGLTYGPIVPALKAEELGFIDRLSLEDREIAEVWIQREKLRQEGGDHAGP